MSELIGAVWDQPDNVQASNLSLIMLKKKVNPSFHFESSDLHLIIELINFSLKHLLHLVFVLASFRRHKPS